MRIMFAADDIDAVGGIQTATHTLAQHLARHGHHVHVVGLYRNTAPAALPQLPIYRRTILNAPPPAASPNGAGLHAAKQQMRQMLTELGSGVLIMSSVHTSLWFQDVHTADYLRIGHYHGSYEYARTQYHLGVIRDLWSSFDASVFLSRDDAAGFATHAALRTTWIPNALPDLPTRPTYLRPAAVSPRVLAVGRLARIKRFDLAIDAFAEAAVRGWQLHIIGDGDEERALRRRVEDHRLQPPGRGPRGVFRGPRPHAAMPAEFAAAQLLTVTSEHEGFGMVVAEAAAAGTPTIAFDVSGGVRSLIQHNRTGLLIAPGDLAGFARALRALMLEPDRRRELGQAARAAAGALSPQTVTARWEQLLTELTQRNRQEASS